MENCPFCSLNEETRARVIKETKNFFILSDIGPIVEGHLLLIPKKHLECFGALDKNLERKFQALKDEIYYFVYENYGFPLIFEHGIGGQTVYHAHLHFIPTKNRLLLEPLLLDKVIEKIRKNEEITGKKIIPVKSFEAVKNYHQKYGKYLYLEERDKKYIVRGENFAPRILREIVAELLGVPERGNWREVKDGQEIVKIVRKQWKKWHNSKPS